MTPEQLTTLEMTSKDLRTERRGGFYWIEGEPYASVTNVLQVLDKPSLRIWGCKEVYRAVAANPYLSEQQALNAMYQIGEDAKARGTTVHSIVEAYKHTHEYIQGIPDQFRGYANAFYRFVEEHPMEIEEHEKTVVSRMYGYAGTLDLLIRFNGAPLPIVADVKTSREIYKEAFLQLSAYRQALREEGIETAGVAVILLQDDGSYKFELTPTDFLPQFLACKTIFDWQNAEDIEKTRKYSKIKPAPKKEAAVSPKIGETYGIQF